MRAARIFLGVGRLHPLVSLQFEMNMLPVKWEAMKGSIEFWVQVTRMANGRLLKMVMIEALELGSKVKWVKDLWQNLEVFGWKELDVEGPECVDGERSEAGFEGYSMEEDERGLERGSLGSIKTGNDWKVNGL